MTDCPVQRGPCCKGRRTPITKGHKLNDRQISHILAALRVWQTAHELGCACNEEIATNGDEHKLMEAEEIDALCEWLNFGHGRR